MLLCRFVKCSCKKVYTKDIHFLHIDKRRGNYYMIHEFEKHYNHEQENFHGILTES